MVDKATIKSRLIALGLATALTGGISAYLLIPKEKELSYSEMLGLITVYNAKLNQIKDNCDTDIRCVVVEGEKRVKIGNVLNDKEIAEKLNEWLREDNEKYKK